MEIPLRFPPPDEFSDFEDPEFLGRPVLITAGICLPIILCFVGIRLYARTILLRHWRVHDYVYSVTCAFSLALIAFAISIVMSEAGHHAWDLDRWAIQRSTIISLLAFWTASGPMLWLLKLTLFSFVFSCFEHVRWFKNFTWVGVILTGLIFSGYTVVVTMTCSPKPSSDLQSYLNGLNRPECSAASGTNAIFSMVAIIANCITNIGLLLISYPLAFKLNLRQREMRGVYSILVTGAIICICSAMSAFYRIKSWQSIDITGSQIPFYASFILEMALSLVIPCLPSVWVVYRHLTDPKIDDTTTIATPYMKSVSSISSPQMVSRATWRKTHDLEELPFRKPSSDYTAPRDSRMKALPVTPLPVALSVPPTPRTPRTPKSPSSFYSRI